MAFKKNTISFSIALMATAFILSSSAAAASVSPFCDRADDKALCTSMAKGAKTWSEAMTNVLKAALQKAKAGKLIADSVGSKLPSNLLPQSKESIDSTCNEAYENVIYNLESCIGFVKNDPQSSLKFYLSAITFSDCKDGLDEFGVSLTEVNQFAGEILKLSSTLLAIADKKP